MKRQMQWAAAAIGALCLTGAVTAAPITIVLDTEFSGADQPAGHLEATFATAIAGPGEVTLTLDAYLVGTEFVSKWYFNVDPAMHGSEPFSLADLSIGHTSGVSATVTKATRNSEGSPTFLRADGDGYFDFMLDFGSNNFTTGTAVFTITGIGAYAGITASSFNFLSVNGPVDKGSWVSAAHVQGVGDDGKGSGWIGGLAEGLQPGPVPIPLPAAAWAGAALLGALGVRRLRQNRQRAE